MESLTIILIVAAVISLLSWLAYIGYYYGYYKKHHKLWLFYNLGSITLLLLLASVDCFIYATNNKKNNLVPNSFSVVFNSSKPNNDNMVSFENEIDEELTKRINLFVSNGTKLTLTTNTTKTDLQENNLYRNLSFGINIEFIANSKHGDYQINTSNVSKYNLVHNTEYVPDIMDHYKYTLIANKLNKKNKKNGESIDTIVKDIGSIGTIFTSICKDKTLLMPKTITSTFYTSDEINRLNKEENDCYIYSNDSFKKISDYDFSKTPNTKETSTIYKFDIYNDSYYVLF